MEIVKQILAKMPGVSRVQQQFIITVLATIYGMRGKVTFSNLSRYSELNEKTYRRHYEEEFDFMGFNVELIKEVKGDNGQIVALDCSFIPKSGKKTYGLDNHYNGSVGRNERGLELATFAIVDLAQNTAYAVDARQTPPELTAKSDDKSDDSTRVDWYGKYLTEIRPNIPPAILYLVADGYFAKEKFIQVVRGQKLQLISKLREDADLKFTYQGKYQGRGRPRKYSNKIDLTDTSQWEFVEEVVVGVNLYTGIAYWMNTKEQVRIAYLQDSRKGDKPKYIVLFSTDLALSAQQILSYYQARFQIEFLFRDAKQFTGLTHCQARDQQKLDFHFNISLLAVNVAKAILRATHTHIHPFIFSLDDFKRRAFNLLLLDRFIAYFDLPSDFIKSQPAFSHLINFGSITP